MERRKRVQRSSWTADLRLLSCRRVDMHVQNTVSLLARRIKKLRKKRGWTQVELAKRSGVGVRFVRELERGKKTTVQVHKLIQVLGALGYRLIAVPKFFLKRTGHSQPSSGGF
jgi:y4mF family transcriptional regulator